MPEDPWEQMLEDVGYELLFITVPLEGGAIDLADMDLRMTEAGNEGWELRLVGHEPTTGTTQLCFRRPVPGRDAHVREIRALRQHLQSRYN